MSIGLELGLIALLLALWAIVWARRAANAAERAAIAAEKNALAAERSAMAAKRGADAAEATARIVRGAGGTPDQGPTDVAALEKATRVDALARELVDVWPNDGSAWPLIERHAELLPDEVEALIGKAFYAMGRTENEAKQHTIAVLNMRRGQTS